VVGVTRQRDGLVREPIGRLLSEGPLTDEYRAWEAATRRCAPSSHPFDANRYRAASIESANSHWQSMMRTEYESSSVFTELALQIREIRAPLDVQVEVLRMAQEELRHAEICGRVVEELGGTVVLPSPPAHHLVRHPDVSAEESVLRNVIYCCCVGETVNAARLAKRLGETEDPFLREALRQLAADETFHAQFGFYYLESQREWLADRPDVRRSLSRYLQYAFAVLEQYMGANPEGGIPISDEERAIGLPDPTETSATFQVTTLNACIPGLERFGIDAGTAWSGRTSAQHPPVG
jgi:hypothetical protein